MYAVIPVTIDFVNLQYTGKSTLLQMWGHFILSKKEISRELEFAGEKKKKKIRRRAEQVFVEQMRKYRIFFR